MNYLKVYNLLVYKRLYINVLQKNINEPGKYEIHHIIPRSCGGKNVSANTVCLTVKEHFLAHHLLIKIYENTQYEKSMKWAYTCMCTTRSETRLSLKQLALIRESISGINNPMKRDDVRKKVSMKLMGHTVSRETRLKQSLRRKGKSPANKGKPISEKQRLDFVGRICINNGKHNRYIHKTDLIPTGWKIGIVRRNYRINTICITNGIESKYIQKDQPLPNGWKYGKTPAKKEFRWITDGNINKQILKTDPIPKGWRIGMTQKQRKNTI